MEEYRKKHAEQYMKRMKEQEDARLMELQKEEQLMEAKMIEEERVKFIVNIVVEYLEQTANAILTADSLVQISHSLSHSFDMVKEHIETWSANEANKTAVNTR